MSATDSLVVDRRPRLLDLFCGAGGASQGYHDAGFAVVGVDIKPQPHYPFEFHQADSIAFLKDEVRAIETWGHRFDAIHASPPCQVFTKARKLQGNAHPDLIEPTRELLIEIGLPYVIENVPGAPLLDPITLCGTMFGLRLYRHRLFESNVPLAEPAHPEHRNPQVKMGRPPQADEFIQVVGHFSNVPEGRRAMGIPWMTQHELAEAIPPAFASYVGATLMESVQLAVERAA